MRWRYYINSPVFSLRIALIMAMGKRRWERDLGVSVNLVMSKQARIFFCVMERHCALLGVLLADVLWLSSGRILCAVCWSCNCGDWRGVATAATLGGGTRVL